MAMVPFYSRFHDLAIRETRSATVRGRPELPAGEYGFIELYCDDIECDCRRVLINVVSATTGGRILATINYGWESVAYYEKWTGSKELAKDMAGATLDPLNTQTEYAPALLELFRFVIEDKAYVERLRRHYELFKADLRRPKVKHQYGKRRSHK